MKTKLLKKIRKRFDWTYIKSLKGYIVINNHSIHVITIDNLYVNNYLDSKEEPNCGYEEMKFRCLKKVLIGSFTSKYSKRRVFKRARVLIKRNKNRNRNKDRKHEYKN